MISANGFQIGDRDLQEDNKIILIFKFSLFYYRKNWKLFKY